VDPQPKLALEKGQCQDQRQRKGVLVHPWSVRAEGEVVPFPSERVEVWARFDVFFEEEHERLFKALYFVTGNRHDAEELMQDAFLKLWERWDGIDRIDDPTAYLFRVALNGFRMRRRRVAMAIRKVAPIPERRDPFLDAEMRADVRQLLLEVTRDSGPPSCSWTCSGIRPSRRRASCAYVRPR
jgi:hypothetical protein